MAAIQRAFYFSLLALKQRDGVLGEAGEGSLRDDERGKERRSSLLLGCDGSDFYNTGGSSRVNLLRQIISTFQAVVKVVQKK